MRARLTQLLFLLGVPTALSLLGCDPVVPAPRAAPAPARPTAQADPPADPQPEPAAAEPASAEPRPAREPSPEAAAPSPSELEASTSPEGYEPAPGPATELPAEAFAQAEPAQLAGGASTPELPEAWLERWRDVGRSSIGTIARGGLIGQRVRVEGYLAHHGSGPQWALLFVDFDDYLTDEATERGGLIALKFTSDQELPTEGRWTSAVGRVVADPDADPQSQYSTLGYLEVEAYLVTGAE